MSDSPPSSPPVSRRAVLAGGTGLAGVLMAAALASCGGDAATPASSPAARAILTVDDVAISRARASAARLLTAAQDLARSRGDLAGLLDAITADHRAHLIALGAASGPASVSPTPTASGGRRTGDAAALVSDETRAAQEALDAVGGTGPAVAVLLARIAAARAAHADLLAAAARLRAPGALRTSSAATSIASVAAGAPGPASPAPLPGEGPAVPALGSASATASPAGTPASGTVSLSDAAGAALRALTAGEHAAVYAYGAVVAFVPQRDRDRARDSWAWHMARRDVLEERLLSAGMRPPVSAPAYDLGAGTLTAASAVTLAATVEDRLAILDARAVAVVTGTDRSDAAEALVAGARRAAAWRGRTTALPG